GWGRHVLIRPVRLSEYVARFTADRHPRIIRVSIGYHFCWCHCCVPLDWDSGGAATPSDVSVIWGCAGGPVRHVAHPSANGKRSHTASAVNAPQRGVYVPGDWLLI